MIEDVRGLQHLDHEGALSGGDVVLRADAGEDAVDQSDASPLSRYERADLRQQGDQRDLPQPAALASHVGAGEDHDLLFAGVEMRVIGYELAAGQGRLQHRMPPRSDIDRPKFVQLGLDVLVAHRKFRQGRDHVDPGDGARGLEQVLRLTGDLSHHPVEDICLHVRQGLLSVEDNRLVLLELRREVASGVGERLLGNVVVGESGSLLPTGEAITLGGGQPGGGHLDVVAKHAVVPDLERPDAGAIPLGPFEVGDPVPGFARLGAMTVELVGKSRPDRLDLAEGGGRLVDQRGGKQPSEIVMGPDRVGVRDLLAEGRHRRNRRERIAQDAELTRRDRRGNGTIRQPLDVLDLSQQLPQPCPGAGVGRHRFDSV